MVSCNHSYVILHLHRSSLETGGGGVAQEEGGAGGVVSSGIGSSPISSPEPSLNPHQYRHDNGNLDKLVSTLEGVSLSLCGGLGQGTISEGIIITYMPSNATYIIHSVYHFRATIFFPSPVF